MPRSDGTQGTDGAKATPSAPTPVAPWPTRYGRVNLKLRQLLAKQGWVR